MKFKTLLWKLRVFIFAKSSPSRTSSIDIGDLLTIFNTYNSSKGCFAFVKRIFELLSKDFSDECRREADILSELKILVQGGNGQGFSE